MAGDHGPGRTSTRSDEAEDGREQTSKNCLREIRVKLVSPRMKQRFDDSVSVRNISSFSSRVLASAKTAGHSLCAVPPCKGPLVTIAQNLVADSLRGLPTRGTTYKNHAMKSCQEPHHLFHSTPSLHRPINHGSMAPVRATHILPRYAQV